MNEVYKDSSAWDMATSAELKYRASPQPGPLCPAQPMAWWLKLGLDVG